VSVDTAIFLIAEIVSPVESLPPQTYPALFESANPAPSAVPIDNVEPPVDKASVE